MPLNARNLAWSRRPHRACIRRAGLL